MIVGGISTNNRYSVEEVKLAHVPMPSAKVFFVVDKLFEATQGPKQTLVMYYPEAKVLDHKQENLKSILRTRRYKADSPDELLSLASEVAPMMYGNGSRPSQHEILTTSDVVRSGSLPIKKDVIRIQGEDVGLFVNYYAKIGPWGDVLNVTAVLRGQRLQVSFHPIYSVPRGYE